MKNSGHKFEYTPEFGIDMQTEHERYLAEVHFKRPVIVRDYPKEIKAFYMRLNDDGRTVAAMDVLVPGIGELIGGSQREERYDVLVRKFMKWACTKTTTPGISIPANTGRCRMPVSVWGLSG